MAVMRRLCKLTAKIGNKTRWLSWGNMMHTHTRMKQHLHEASLMDNNTIEADQTWLFQARSTKVTKIFADMNMVGGCMQHRLYALKSCRSDLDALLKESEDGEHSRASHWFGCKLKGVYIGRASEKLSHPNFISGVVKIQENKHMTLTQDEKDACKRLLIEEEVVDGAEQNVHVSLADRMRDRIKKRKAGVFEADLSSPYRNVDFICGSAAEVERLWSIAKHVLTNNRSRLTPAMFETLLFLKMNDKYWDIQSVQEAYTRARNNTQSSAVTAMILEDDEAVE